MTAGLKAFSGTLSIGMFHYLLRTAMALAVAWPLGHAAGSQFDINQGLAVLAPDSVGWAVGGLMLAGLLLAPWTHLAISYALAYRRSIATGFAMTSVRYLDAVRVGLALLLIKILLALFALALGLGVHAALYDARDPRLHDLALLAIGCLGLGGIFCITLWHDVARCTLVLRDQPWLPALRTAAAQALHRGIYRPYAALFMLGTLLAFGAVALGIAHQINLATAIASQQVLLFGYSLCRVARLNVTLTNVDLNP